MKRATRKTRRKSTTRVSCSSWETPSTLPMASISIPTAKPIGISNTVAYRRKISTITPIKRQTASLQHRKFSKAAISDEEMIPIYDGEEFDQPIYGQIYDHNMDDIPKMEFPTEHESIEKQRYSRPRSNRQQLPTKLNIVKVDQAGNPLDAEQLDIDTSKVDPNQYYNEFHLEQRITPLRPKAPKPFESKLNVNDSLFMQARQQRESEGVKDLPEMLQAQRRACTHQGTRHKMDLQHIATHCRSMSIYEATVVLFDAIRDRCITPEHVITFFVECLKKVEHEHNPALRKTLIFRVHGATSTLIASMVTFSTLDGPYLLNSKVKNAITQTLVAAELVDLLDTFYRALLYVHLNDIRSFSSREYGNPLPKVEKEATDFLEHFESLEDHFTFDDLERKLRKKIPDHIIIPFMKRFAPGQRPFPSHDIPAPILETSVTSDMINQLIACAAKLGRDELVHAWVRQLELNGQQTTPQVDNLLLVLSASHLAKMTITSTGVVFSSSFITPSIDNAVHSPSTSVTPIMPIIPLSSLISDLNFHCLRARDILDRALVHSQYNTNNISSSSLISPLHLGRYLQILSKSIIPPSFADTFYGQDQLAEVVGSEALGSRVDHAFDIIRNVPPEHELKHSQGMEEPPIDKHPGIISIYDWPWRHHRTAKENPGLDSRYDASWDRLSPHVDPPLHERPRYLSLENYIDAVLPDSIEGQTRRRVLKQRNRCILLSMIATTTAFFDNEANKKGQTSFLTSSTSLFSSAVSTQILNSLIEALLRADHPTIAMALLEHSKSDTADVTAWGKWLRNQFTELSKSDVDPSLPVEFQPVPVENIMDITDTHLNKVYPLLGFTPRHIIPRLRMLGQANGKSKSKMTKTQHVFLRPSFQSYELIISYAMANHDVTLAFMTHSQLLSSDVFENDSTSSLPSKIATLSSNVALTLLRGPLTTVIPTNRDDFSFFPNDSWASIDPELTSVIPSQSMCKLKDQLGIAYQAYSLLVSTNPFQYGRNIVSPSLQISILALAAYSGDITSCVRIIYSMHSMHTLAHCIQWTPHLLTIAYSQALFLRNAESYDRLEVEDSSLYSLGDHYDRLLQLRQAVSPLVESLLRSDLDPSWQIAHLPHGTFDIEYYNRILGQEDSSPRIQGFRSALRELSKRFGKNIPNWDQLIQASRRELNVLTKANEKVKREDGHIAYLPPPATLVKPVPALFETTKLPDRLDGLFIDIIPNRSSSQWHTTKHEQHADLRRTMKTLLYSKSIIKQAIRSFSQVYYRSFIPFFLNLSRPTTTIEPMRLTYTPSIRNPQEFLDTCLNDVIQIYNCSLQHLSLLYGDHAQPVPVLPTLLKLRPPGVNEDLLSRFILMTSNTTISPLEQATRVGHILTEEPKQEHSMPFQPEALSVFPKNVVHTPRSTHISPISIDDLMYSMNVEAQASLLIQSASVYALLKQPNQCRNILMKITSNRQQYTMYDKSMFTFPLSSLIMLLNRITVASPFYTYVHYNAGVLTPRKPQNPIEMTYSRIYKSAELYLTHRGIGTISLEQPYKDAVKIANTRPDDLCHIINTGSTILFDVLTQYGITNEPKYSIIALFYSRYLVAKNSCDDISGHDQIARLSIASVKVSGLIDHSVDPDLSVESSRVAIRRSNLNTNLQRLVTNEELDGLTLLIEAMTPPPHLHETVMDEE